MNKSKNEIVSSLSNQCFYLLLISLLASFHETFYFPFIGGGARSALQIIQGFLTFIVFFVLIPVSILSPNVIFRYYPSRCCNNRIYKSISKLISTRTQPQLQTMIIITYLISSVVPIRVVRMAGLAFNIMLIYQYSLLSHQQLNQQSCYQYPSQLGYSLFYFTAFKIINSSVNSLYWDWYYSIPLVVVTLIVRTIDCYINCAHYKCNDIDQFNNKQQTVYQSVQQQQQQQQQSQQQSPSKVCMSLLLIGQLNNISIIVSSPFLTIRSSSIQISVMLILQYSIGSFALYAFIPFLTRKVDQYRPIVGLIVAIIQLVLVFMIILLNGQIVIISAIIFNGLNQLQYQIYQQYLAHSSSLKSIFSYFQYWLFINQILIFIDWFNIFEFPFLIVVSNVIMVIAHLIITCSEYFRPEQLINQFQKTKQSVSDFIIFQVLGLLLITLIFYRTYQFPSNNNTDYSKPLTVNQNTFKLISHNIQRGFQQQPLKAGLNLNDGVKLIDQMDIQIYLTQESECHYPITGNRDLGFYYQQEVNTRMNSCYGLAPNLNRFDGAMMVTRYPILYCQGIKFYNYAPFPQFVATYSIVRISISDNNSQKYKDVHIVNIHPALIPKDINSKSIDQVVELLSGLLSTDSSTPIVLAGDFNLKYEDPLIDKFIQLGFKHVYQNSTLMPYTRPDTNGKIDHILYINLVNTDRQVLSQYDQSDHLPIYAEFKFS